jgi:hypothetical protein
MPVRVPPVHRPLNHTSSGNGGLMAAIRAQPACLIAQPACLSSLHAINIYTNPPNLRSGSKHLQLLTSEDGCTA